MEIAMYAVYYTVSDGCTFSSDTLMFVTESEQTAKDAVTLAELEYREALKVPTPYSILDRKSFSDLIVAYQELEALESVYNEKIKAILTVHPDRAEDFNREDDNSYYYEKVEVR